jgi:hypothetical protein
MKRRDQLSRALDEIDELHKSCNSRELQIKELKQRIESLQKDMGKHIAAAAQWEARFDLLLRIASGEAANAARWSEVVAKMAKWTE